MTKLYISGAIAADPDFKQKFKDWQIKLEAAGFQTVNPVEVDACLDQACGGEILDTDTKDGETITEYRHTWSCYMKYDLVAMLQCDGVAALPDAVESPGARAEMYVAGLVGIPVKPIRLWVVESIKEQIAQPIVSANLDGDKITGFVQDLNEAVYASIGFTTGSGNFICDTDGLDTVHSDEPEPPADTSRLTSEDERSI